MARDDALDQITAQVHGAGGKSRDVPRDRGGQALAELRGRRYINKDKDTQFSDAWVFVSVLLTGFGMALDSRFLLAGALALLVIAAVGWLWNELSLFGLHYERRLSETRAFLGETVELTLEVRNRKFLPITWLQAVDIIPAVLPMDQAQARVNQTTHLGEFTSFWSLGAFQRVTRRFTVRCTERGYHAYGPVRMTTGDGFGMFSRTGALPLRQRLIVYPRLYAVAELRLPAKNPFGERLARETLFEDPLRTAGIREWQPADGLKRVHWKATARHHQMLSRLYEPSEEPQVLIFLNVATLTRHWLGNIPELLERAVSVAGSLAALAAELRLPVGLIANGFLPESDQPLRLLPGRSPDQLVRILELLAAITSFATRPIEELLITEAPRLPWGATLLVVTAIAHDELLATLVDLARAGRKVVLFTLAEKPPQELMPGITIYHLPHLVADLIVPELIQTADRERTAQSPIYRQGVA